MKNKKIEKFRTDFDEMDKDGKEELSKFIKDNPGATVGELYEVWNGLDGYSFLKAMVELIDEYKVVEDGGQYFSDEDTRIKMVKERAC